MRASIVQHDNPGGFLFCHPGPCPELDSGLVRDLGCRGDTENREEMLIQNILHRVGWNVVNSYFIVKMGTRRPTTHPELCDLISSFHPLVQSH